MNAEAELSVGSQWNIPELQIPIKGNIRHVPIGSCIDGFFLTRFVSYEFKHCSALILKTNTFITHFGFFHIYPGQMIEEDSLQTESLKRLKGAKGILVEGSESTPKGYLLRDLKKRFGIEVARPPIPINTNRIGTDPAEKTPYPYHVVFRPASNEILVARLSHNDIVSLTGF